MPQKNKHGRTGAPKPQRAENVRVCLLMPSGLWVRVKAAAKASDQSACRYVRRKLEGGE